MGKRSGKQIDPEKHSVKTALLLGLIPGIGQLYNRRYIKGVIMLGLTLAFIVTFYDFFNMGYWGLFT